MPTRSTSACATSRTPRDIAVIKAAAEKANWQPRPSPRKGQTGNKVVRPRLRLCAAQRHARGGDRRSRSRPQDRQVWARKFTVAHDCGQIINPDGLRLCIEGNIVQGASRTLWEEMTFDSNKVTSVDWLTYPILDITEAPGEVDIVLINHPDIAAVRRRRASIRPVAAAIANAIFDATGVRIRRAPFSPERVKAALS